MSKQFLFAAVRSGWSVLCVAALVSLVTPSPWACGDTKYWDGEGTGDAWSTPKNWDADGVPTAAADVILDDRHFGTAYIVSVDVDPSFATLTLDSQYATLSDATTSGISNYNGEVHLTRGTLDGTPWFVLTAVDMTLGDSVTGNAHFDFTAYTNTLTVAGDILEIGKDVTIRNEGAVYGHLDVLTSSGTFTNYANIVMDSTSGVEVHLNVDGGAGTLVNYGMLDSGGPHAVFPRYDSLALDNHNLYAVNSNTYLGTATGAQAHYFRDGGTVDVADDVSLILWGNSLTQEGGDFNVHGAFELTGRTFTMDGPNAKLLLDASTGGEFTSYQGTVKLLEGTLSGSMNDPSVPAVFNLSASNLVLGSASSLQGKAHFDFTGYNNTLAAVGNTLKDGDKITIRNEGAVYGRLDVDTDPQSDVPGTFTNRGVIVMDSTSGVTVELNVDGGAGTLINYGMLDSGGPHAVWSRYNSFALDNYNDYQVNSNTYLGTAAGAQAHYFRDGGTVDVADDVSLILWGASLTQEGGDFNVHGAFELTGRTFTMEGPNAKLLLDASTGGEFTSYQGTVKLLEGTVASGSSSAPAVLNLSASNLELGEATSLEGVAHFDFTAYNNTLAIADDSLKVGDKVTIRNEGAVYGRLDVATTSGTFTNNGVIVMDSTSGVTVELNVDGGAGTLVNYGMLDSGGPHAVFPRYDSFALDNRGELQINSDTFLNNSRHAISHINSGDILLANRKFTLYGDSFTNDLGGVIRGAGTLEASTLASGAIDDEGFIAPGFSIGTLAITGDWNQSPTGVYLFEADGTGAGQYDQLAVSGDIAADGILKFSVLSGSSYAPTIGDSLNVATAGGSISSTMAAVGASLPSVISVDGGNLKLTFAAPVTTSFTGDGDATLGGNYDHGAGTPPDATKVVTFSTTGDPAERTFDVGANRVNVHELHVTGGTSTAGAAAVVNVAAGGNLIVGNSVTLSGDAPLSVTGGSLVIGGALTAESNSSQSPPVISLTDSTLMQFGDLNLQDNSSLAMTGGSAELRGATTIAASATATFSNVPTVRMGGAVEVNGQLSMTGDRAWVENTFHIGSGGRYTGTIGDGILFPKPTDTALIDPGGWMQLNNTPVAAAGNLTVGGWLEVVGASPISAHDYTQSVGARLMVQPGTLASLDEFPSLELAGTATLNGVLLLEPDYIAGLISDGASFTLLTATGGVAPGTHFSALASIEPLHWAMVPHYNANSVVITFVAPVLQPFEGNDSLSNLTVDSTTDLAAVAAGVDGSLLIDASATLYGLDVSGTNSTMTVTGAAGVILSATGGVTVGAGGVLTSQANGWTLYTPELAINGGTLAGNIAIIGNVINAGLVTPGLSPGTIAVEGDYTQTAAGELLIEIGGTTAGTEYDVLAITGTAALDGLLSVELINAGGGLFVPGAGDRFEILTATEGITGSFMSEMFPAIGGGLSLDVVYDDSAVLLDVVGVEGDYNYNGTVDAADYVIWRDTLRATGFGLAADGHSDGVIDTLDYDVWRSHFGETSANAVAAEAIPEPSTLTLAVLCLSGAVALGRRSQH